MRKLLFILALLATSVGAVDIVLDDPAVERDLIFTNWLGTNTYVKTSAGLPYYPLAGNPSNCVTQAVTNGLYPSSNPAGYVDKTVTNGLVGTGLNFTNGTTGTFDGRLNGTNGVFWTKAGTNYWLLFAP
jgi:hypothetical protein